ncbi:hypothetical protein SPRG_11511 [Saprolegnia parasitica CBS 223.65]|uniref:Uncharacterized protein n=1 Tax=Saprolegnia parasitica (strain CBS 223.65) TaxID=695850 RepID=A0A067BYQ9_SAPPC|nr:hypothetical protein SPRG_11511 [Saprolegnia parasitica CBS 223.65]KDO23418.1 hypothetical protein SPRG_11511 [Saprolegnia parasitica CBS 223.65]|eukprot:XP_012205906.1 hypothetical protein SPRG_11511 [Saprolegnia parasitica CBS 223.65]
MDPAKSRARTTKVSRYLDANPRATMADVARLVTIHEGLSKADVDAWTVFTTTPPEEIIDAAVAFKELGVLGDKAKNSDLVKRELWFLSNVGVKTSTKGKKKHYNVSALSMTCVILALPEEHKARCTLVAIKMAFRTFLTRQEKEKRQAEPTIEHPTKKRTQSEPAAPLESPVAKRIKTNLASTPQTPTKTEIKAEGTEDAFMYLTPPHPTNQTKYTSSFDV